MQATVFNPNKQAPTGIKDTEFLSQLPEMTLLENSYQFLCELLFKIYIIFVK